MFSTVLETSHSSLLTVLFLPVTKTDTVLQLPFCVRKKVKPAYFSSQPELFCHSIFLRLLIYWFLQTIWKNWFILCPSLAVNRFLPEKSFPVSLVFCSICNLFQTGNSTCKKALVIPGLICCLPGCFDTYIYVYMYIYIYVYIHTYIYTHTHMCAQMHTEASIHIFIGINYKCGSWSQSVKMDYA